MNWYNHTPAQNKRSLSRIFVLLFLIASLILSTSVVFAMSDNAGEAPIIKILSSETQNTLSKDWLHASEAPVHSTPEANLSGYFWLLNSILVFILLVAISIATTGKFKHMLVRNKLYSSFGMLVLFSALLGGFSYYYLSKSHHLSELALTAMEMDMLTNEIALGESEFLLHGIENKAFGDEKIAEIKGLADELHATLEGLEKNEWTTSTMQDQISSFSSNLSGYEKQMEKVTSAYHQIENIKESLDKTGDYIEQELDLMLHQHEAELNELSSEGSYTKRDHMIKLIEHIADAELAMLRIAHAEVKFLLDKKPSHIISIEKNLGKLHFNLNDLIEENVEADENKRLLQIVDLVNKYTEWVKLVADSEAQIMVSTAAMDQYATSLEHTAIQLNAHAIALSDEAVHEADLAIIILICFSVFAGTICAYSISNAISVPLTSAINLAKDISQGDFNKSLQLNRNDEIGQLADAVNDAATSLRQKAEIASHIATGDLSKDIIVRSEKDLLGIALNNMQNKLRDIISTLQSASYQVNTGAGMISETSQNLSQGATEQAASTEELTSTMVEIGSQVDASSKQAEEAYKLSNQTSKVAQEGNHSMNKMVHAMSDISDSSKAIVKIIQVIDEIAFQTNLLALNAAVEAARAGQHGKGFAVVAEEVRNLAGRSAKAAQETAELIEGSNATVQQGAQNVEKTADSLKGIVDQIEQVTSIINEMSTASKEQAYAISQVNEALGQVETVTQSNSSSSEETAAAAEELSSQATELENLVAQFTLAPKAKTQVSAHSVPAAPLPAAPLPATTGGWGQAQSNDDAISLNNSHLRNY
ncbi:MAG: methyl-accepting chemotaxis protein [Desulfovibrio sp.]